MLIGTAEHPDDPARERCRYAAYIAWSGRMVCRCVTCPRCKEHTGNSHQGHDWSWCKVTGAYREFHFCCPDGCELESTDG